MYQKLSNQFETRIRQQNDRLTLDMELRAAELEKLKAEKKKAFSEVEAKVRMQVGAAPTELIQQHRNMLIEIEQLMENER